MKTANLTLPSYKLNRQKRAVIKIEVKIKEKSEIFR